MILKQADDRSGDIGELKRLRERAPSRFRVAIQKQIDNLYAGVAGERDAAHFLGREFGSSKDIAILHDLRIGVGGEYAQIDHLVIHRIQATAWVLETKNYAGRLVCDEDGDWTVWRNGRPTSIASPINQARRQSEMLRLWFDANEISAILNINSVVLISPTSSVSRKQLPVDAYVVKSDNFGAWWRKQAGGIGFSTALGIVSRHMLRGMSHDDFKSLGEQLIHGHIPATFDWRAKLRLPNLQKEAGTDRQENLEADTDVESGDVSADTPKLILTPHGEIRITRIPDGRYALRNDKDAALIDIVRGACKGLGQWIPRYQNWLIAEKDLPKILAKIAPYGDSRA